MLRAILGLCGCLGFGLLVAACDEAPPPTPAGAYNVAFSQTGGTCAIASHQNTLGEVGGSGDPTLVTSGSQGSTITCTIESASGGFHVSADLEGSATVSIEIASISDKATDTAPVDGTVTYASQQTAGDVFSSQGAAEACHFWIDGNNGQYVRAGEAYLTFECPTIDSEANVCKLSRSYVAVKNCLGATEDT